MEKPAIKNNRTMRADGNAEESMKKITKKEMEKEMTCKHCIVKRKGHTEEFDERKIYSSCHAAFLSTGMNSGAAEKNCDKVCMEIRKWAHKKVMMTSDEIFRKAVAEIKKHSPKAAFMYETHRDIS
jgi:transcriptional regulator NrdR family protein